MAKKSDDLTGAEIRQLVGVIYNTLKLLTDEKALAGIVLTNKGFDKMKEHFGPEAKPYNPSGILEADPLMKDVFVVDGLLIMRGTMLQ